MAGSSGLLRCPPYCKSSCTVRHHPLLLAVVNCIDTEEDQEMMESLLQDLQDCINDYTKDGKWKKEGVIPDPNEAYQFPMIHWACALGRVFAVLWLIEEDFKPTQQTTEGDTGLHRAIYCLQETCPKEALQKFQKLVPPMESALLVKNLSGCTPVHTCCQLLHKEVPKVEFHYECLAAMVGHGKRKGDDFLKSLLSSQNAEGDTPLHILSQHDRNMNGIKLLIEAGARTDIENKKGFKPLDVAIDCGQLKLSKYFQDLRVIQRKTHKQNQNTSSDIDVLGGMQSNSGGLYSPSTPRQSSRKIRESPKMTSEKRAVMPAETDVGSSIKCPVEPNSSSLEPDPKKAKTSTTLLWKVNIAAQPPEERNSLTINAKTALPTTAKSAATTTVTTAAGKGTVTSNEQNILSYFKYSTSEARSVFRKAMERDRDIHQRELHDMDIEKKKLTNSLAATIEQQQEASQQIQRKLQEIDQLQKKEQNLKGKIQGIHNRLDSISQMSLKAQEQFRTCQHALDAFDKL
ncbi:uncharacterized protein LOC106174876 [Lingula anatina]|uniref:Uncharacterized protein LOC106174876 n=1 Tax=Lingula anatina TaxID=7574 RepID=A0A1S3JNZ9_LINAN|nr:uncharacterized protein LOC106174876 [Lingula anatina]|eukprot:XP_013412072.1 uncharacterized protein LOC106174876 [Lingula anatina]